jgi:1-deoxy-D-xylulose-5-phosphate synthase
VKALRPDQLPQLAQEIRDELIEVTAVNGGHLGPNLGVVELTIALHRVFDSPKDRLIWDVSHQGYVHKLLTGRNCAEFRSIRRTGGLSGFLNREESEHDHYGAGHAGTALSAALGMAVARDLQGGDENVVAVCGDAAFTCGITLEALNNIAHSTKRLVVILNDNEWSIAKNVGAIARYLSEIITDPRYKRLHEDLDSFLDHVPGGRQIKEFGHRWKETTKGFFAPSSLFEKFGLRYVGPIDGHNLDQLHKYLEWAKLSDVPVLLHVLTVKGKGYDIALSQPERFHGLSPFDKHSGKSKPAAPGTPPLYQDVFGQALTRFAKQNPKIVGITGAMPSGTGLSHLAQGCPSQFFDVGIAEEHAVLFAAGMATRGIKPVCAIYSTFLQRAFDPIVHDVCLQNLPVTFCMDRAGLSPNDGPTHHGLFDIAYLRCVPNAVVMQPKDEDELVDMLWTSLNTPAPMFVRYPRGNGTGVTIKESPAMLPIGQAEVLREGSACAFWALGPWVQEAVRLAEEIERDLGIRITVVNARFAKPLDRQLLLQHARSHRLIVTFEDHVVTGGFGSAVSETLQLENVPAKVEMIAWPDAFVGHGSSVEILRAQHGLAPAVIRQRVEQALGSLAAVPEDRGLQESAPAESLAR